jgi:hypothetical protein
MGLHAAYRSGSMIEVGVRGIRDEKVYKVYYFMTVFR